MSKSFECPNCGITIQVDDSSPLRVECPNCFENVANPYAKVAINNNLTGTLDVSLFSGATANGRTMANENIVNPNGNDGNYVDGIAASQYDKNGVKETFRNALSQSAGIYSGINIESIGNFCIPFHVFHVSYQAPWKGLYEWSEFANTQIQSLQKKTEEAEGMVSGEFCYICKAFSSADIPTKLQRIIDSFAQIPQNISPYNYNSNSYNTTVIQPNLKFVNAWYDRIAPQLMERARQEAGQQASANMPGSFMSAMRSNKIGAKLQKFDFQVNYTINNCQTVLIPFWMIDYSYENRQYSFIIDGSGNVLSSETPQGQTQSTTSREPSGDTYRPQNNTTNSEPHHETEQGQKFELKSILKNTPLMVLLAGIFVGIIGKSFSAFVFFLAIAAYLYYKKKK